MKRLFRLGVYLGFIVWVLSWPAGARAGQGFVLDGAFDDWQGRAHLADGRGDGREDADFKALAWGTNENERRLYFMVERQLPAAAGRGCTCRLYFDVDCNGSYDNSVDKYAEVTYRPVAGGGRVAVELYSASGHLLAVYRGRWGEAGGRRFEFAVPMNKLGIYPAQPVRFYLSGIGAGADRLPDRGDNQWAPFPGTVKSKTGVAAVCFVWLAVAAILRRHRIWPFYYIWGAVGFTFIMVLFFQGSLLEYQVEYRTGMIVHRLLRCLDIVTYVFDKAPGTLLVLIKMDESWTTIDIDIESSGLLELCIFLGLVLFYPAYRPASKLLFSLAGVASVYLFNLLRLVLVVVAIYCGGRNMSFIAHTLFGRLVFFVLIVVLYWYVFTRPSLKKVREYVGSG
ncbi:MAG: exosortase family protein XrtG [Bacillota bacterium]